MLVPSRRNCGCGLILTTTYRLPGGPPRRPASPSPLRRICIPSSTPGGIDTLILRVVCTRFCPRQVEQGVETTSPSPSQRGQVPTLTNDPKMDCCTRRISPVPWHCGQRIGVVPGSAPLPWQFEQVSRRGISSSFSTPKTASSKDSVRLYLRWAPGCGPRRAVWRFPKPKNSSMISAKPPNPLKSPLKPPVNGAL